MLQLLLKGKRMPYPGQILGGTYQIVDEIGKGGVGIIYLAYHLNLQKYVVVKKIKDHYAGVLEARAEADILKSLHHGGLPQVYDFLQLDHEIYTVMDYIAGHDLKYYIDYGCQFEETLLWSWLTQLCEILEYLHDHGILHLDIKPANIMLTPEGKLYLIDFNISLAGEGENLSGISPYYASPEQYRKWKSLLYETEDREGALDGRTDIYSLGAVFYHLMTGVMPQADLNYLIPISHYELNYSKELVSIIDRMMKPGKRQRFQSVSKIRSAVKRIQRTKEEKKTLQIVFYGMLSAIVVLLLVIGILFFRNQNHLSAGEREMLIRQEARIRQLYDAGEYEAAYSEGIRFFNANADAIEKGNEEKMSFLEMLADCCIGMESYEEALRLAKELLDMDKKPEYYNLAAVATAYLGDYEQAEAYLKKAEEGQGKKQDMERSRAEMKAAQGAYEEAIKIYQSLQEETNDSSLLRRIAVLALKKGKDDSEYAELSVSCYERLLKEETASYSDRMNLVTAYLDCGMNERALSVLQEMAVLYPEQYEVYVRMGILRYNMEIKKAPSERDFSKTKQNAEKAIQLYDAVSSKAEDEEIETLRQLLETLPQ